MATLDEVNQDAIATGPPAAEATQVRPWKPTTRLGFRFAFSYLMTYCLCNGNATLWESLPYAGGYISNWLSRPLYLSGQYLAQHTFHVRGVGGHLHDTGSGDTAIDWIATGVLLAFALVATAVWTILDRRRQDYATLYAWLRFAIRLTLGIGMIQYGFAKLFPLQMRPPMLAVLNEPVGNMSPMTMLWTMLGLSPVYESICGAAEIASGVLILFRKTALAGALLTVFVMTNVVLYNFFFDVPVKLYAAHLLILSLFVVLPDIQPLIDFFWRHVPTETRGIWIPPSQRKSFRIATAIVEGLFLFSCVASSIYGEIPGYLRLRASVKEQTLLWGGWRLEHDQASITKTKPLLTGDGAPMVELYIDTNIRGSVRSSDGALWRTSIRSEPASRKIKLMVGDAGTFDYTFATPDIDHLILTPTGSNAAKESVLRFTRIPIPSSYPLLTRGFHFVNEWGLER